MSALPDKLNDFWLWKEISQKLNLSNPTYKYWNTTKHIKLNNKYIFLQKNTLPLKYAFVEENLTDLSGLLPVRFAADSLGINEHIFTYEKMSLYKAFEFRYICGIKFVNLKKFFIENGIEAGKDSVIHLGKIKNLEINENSRFYNIDNNYGIVVYG